MTATVSGIHGGLDTHGNRPAGNAVPDGSLYSCSTHNLIYKSNLAGNSWATWGTLSGGSVTVATDTIWDAAGDLVQGTGADTAAKLSAGTAGMFLKSAGAAAANIWAFPPGTELDYVQITTGVTINGTSEGGSVTCITGTSQAYAAVPTLITVFCSRLTNGAGGTVIVLLYDGATVLGRLALSNAQTIVPLHATYRLTPTAATHQYIVKAYRSVADGVFDAGAGGTGVELPSFIRVTKV